MNQVVCGRQRTTPTTRQMILVLGMHRSGTSAVAGALGLLGAQMPAEVLPASADNEKGYWEPARIVAFNERLLRQAGSGWRDPSPLSPTWFCDVPRVQAQTEAVELLAAAYPGGGPGVLKDPRMCRLLPLWTPVLNSAGIDSHALLVLRDPRAVAESLAARALAEKFRPLGIAAQGRAVILWLRYVLDAERHTRGLPRSVVDYAALVSDWRATLGIALAEAELDVPIGQGRSPVDAFLSRPGRQEPPPPPLDSDGSVTLLDAVGSQLRRPELAVDADWLDSLRASLDELCGFFGPLLRTRDNDASDPASELILAELVRRHAAGADRELASARLTEHVANPLENATSR